MSDVSALPPSDSSPNDQEILQIFIEEARGLLSDLDRKLFELEQNPKDGAVLDLILRKLHTVKGAASSIHGCEKLGALMHGFESVLSLLKRNMIPISPALISAGLATASLSETFLRGLNGAGQSDAAVLAKIDDCIETLKAVSRGETAAPGPSVAVETPQKGGEPNWADIEAVMVANEQLDDFMRAAGQLVILKNYLNTLALDPTLRADPAKMDRKMADLVYSFDKVSDRLQQLVMSVRKVYLDHAFQRLPRMVRQLCGELGKKVRLDVTGADLAVDKNIARALSFSMTHLIRNAIDHGIETTEARRRAGKPEEGRLEIAAHESGGWIRVRVRDDGMGIDPERVRAKALANGLLTEAQAHALGETEILEMIFMPGFSTAEKITDISGRGVGMDAVKDSLAALDGRITTLSRPGAGTEFLLEIPVIRTVVVENTIVVRDPRGRLAIPVSGILGISPSETLRLVSVNGHLAFEREGVTIPLFELRQAGADPVVEKTASDDWTRNGVPVTPVRSQTLAPCSVVVLEHRRHSIGLVVSAIESQLEAVIRPFDEVIGQIPGFKGTTVLADDGIAFVLSPPDLVGLALGLGEFQRLDPTSLEPDSSDTEQAA